jgi:hypothetical protein
MHFQILGRFLQEEKLPPDEVRTHGGGRIEDSPDKTTMRLRGKSEEFGPVPAKLHAMVETWAKEYFPDKKIDIQTLVH